MRWRFLETILRAYWTSFNKNKLCLIVVLGNELYQKTIEECEKERQQNVTEVEQRAWRLASEEKARALKSAKEAAEVELDKALAAAKKAQVGVNFKEVHLINGCDCMEKLGWDEGKQNGARG